MINDPEIFQTFEKFKFLMLSLISLFIIGGSNESNASILVTFCGKVKFQGSDFKAFTQTIILTVCEDKWKIVSDTFRFSDWSLKKIE